MEDKEYILIEKKKWQHIVSSLKELSVEISILKSKHLCCKSIFTNKDIREILGVNDKLIRKYRKKGLLEYSNIGNKYWYTLENIKKFLKCGRNKN